MKCGSLLLFLCLCPMVVGQSAPPASPPKPHLVIDDLAPLSYPPIALAAHVYGDVVLAVDLKRDGTVDTVTVASGPQMLRSVAVASAQKSRFKCEACRDDITSLILTYKFELGPAIYCSEPTDGSFPFLTHSGDTITIGAQPFGTCDLATDRIRTRSMKCLYLWKCGWRN